MHKRTLLNTQRTRRTRRNRARISGSAHMPRLAVFRSNRAISAQLIDDDKATTLTHASTHELGKEGEKKTKKEQARLVGTLIAKRAKEGGITKAVFDRRSYRYHGRVRALAEGAREAGLTI